MNESSPINNSSFLSKLTPLAKTDESGKPAETSRGPVKFFGKEMTVDLSSTGNFLARKSSYSTENSSEDHVDNQSIISDITMSDFSDDFLDNVSGNNSSVSSYRSNATSVEKEVNNSERGCITIIPFSNPDVVSNPLQANQVESSTGEEATNIDETISHELEAAEKEYKDARDNAEMAFNDLNAIKNSSSIKKPGVSLIQAMANKQIQIGVAKEKYNSLYNIAEKALEKLQLLEQRNNSAS